MSCKCMSILGARAGAFNVFWSMSFWYLPKMPIWILASIFLWLYGAEYFFFVVFCFVLQICTGMMRIIRIHIFLLFASLPPPSRLSSLTFPSLFGSLIKFVFDDSAAMVMVDQAWKRVLFVRQAIHTKDTHPFIHPPTQHHHHFHSEKYCAKGKTNQWEKMNTCQK